MTHDSDKTATELRGLAKKLLAMADAMDRRNTGNPVVSEAIAAKVAGKVASRVCLQCGKSIPDDEPQRRGLCAKDYIATQRAVDSGETSYHKLIEAGLFTAERSHGRKRKLTALDAFIAGDKTTAPTPAEKQKAEKAFAEIKEIVTRKKKTP